MTDQINDQSGSNGETPGDGPEPPAATPLNTPTAPGPTAGADAPPGERFSPLTNESDMFKVLVGIVIFAAIAISLVLIGRAVF